jgi:hypothetical protein
VCASKNSPECSVAVELEFGMMFVCSTVSGDEMGLHFSSEIFVTSEFSLFCLLCLFFSFRLDFGLARLRYDFHADLPARLPCLPTD